MFNGINEFKKGYQSHTYVIKKFEVQFYQMQLAC